MKCPVVFCNENPPSWNCIKTSFRRVNDLNKRGVIPEAMVQLKHLIFLKLDKNYFTGPLPAFIGNLTKITSQSSLEKVSGQECILLGTLMEKRMSGLVLVVNQILWAREGIPVQLAHHGLRVPIDL